jgi:hypothetical protein
MIMKFSELPSHHALLVTCEERGACADSLWSDLSSLSPAHRFFDQTVLDIETARKIISWAQSPHNGERVALISFHMAGLPAQNAMLKILEEPRGGTRFIIVTSDKKNLIDTVLSRVRHVFYGADGKKEKKHADEFLASVPQSRMKLPIVVDILSRVDEEGRKDREAVKGFILSLADRARARSVDRSHIAELLECASYASDPSASGKALLEYLALLLPQTSQ